MRIDYNNPRENGAFCMPYHYEMVSDKKRVGAFKTAIQQVCQDKIVLESGTGSGILSLLAAQAGAKKVYAFEKDFLVSRYAENNFRKSGYENIIFGHKDILTTWLEDTNEERPGVIIAENLSTWMVTEPIIQVMNHLNRIFATEQTIRLPSAIFNYLELAQSNFRFEDALDVRTYYFEFSGIERPVRLSEPTLFNKVDLSKVNPQTFSGTVQIPVTQSGTLNSLRLTSPILLAESVKFEGSDSLMPPVVVPLTEDLSVQAGDTVAITISYRANLDWSQFNIKAKVLANSQVNLQTTPNHQ